FGYCYEDGGLGATHCRFIDTAGKATTMSNVAEIRKGDLSGLKTREIRAWLTAHHVPNVKDVPDVQDGALETTGPALTGTWRYARDIEIRIDSVAGTEDAEHNAVRQPALRVGGRVASHEPVFPFTVTTTKGIGTPGVFNGVLPNGIALSP